MFIQLHGRYDSVLLTLSRYHAPYFTRNIVILEDKTRNKRIGKMHEMERITEMLESYKSMIIGTEINMKKLLKSHELYTAKK